jgi:RNA polymerase sigma-70 factor (ECF subfamily)
MPDPSSDALLEALRLRKPEAIAQAVRRYSGDLTRAARGLGFPQADAEELVQAAFVAFLDSVPRFEGRSSIRTYLFGILYNKALERGRERSRELAVDPADQIFETRFNRWGHWSLPPKGPEEEISIGEVSRIIAQCLEGLPLQQRAAFQLKEIERMPSAAICNILGVQDTHLRVLLFRARNKLRACIEAKWK